MVFSNADSRTSNGTVTWDETLSFWWDYQALAVSPAPTSNFLSVWGGDARLGSGRDGVWSTVIQ